MILLQAGGPNLGAGTVDPRMFLFIGIAVVGVIALLLIGGLVSRRARPSTTETAERISSGVFRREAKRVGRADVQGQAASAGLLQREPAR